MQLMELKMKKLKPLKKIKAPNFTLYPDEEYPITYENETTYYARIMNIKFGIDRSFENDLFEIIIEKPKEK